MNGTSVDALVYGSGLSNFVSVGCSESNRFVVFWSVLFFISPRWIFVGHFLNFDNI